MEVGRRVWVGVAGVVLSPLGVRMRQKNRRKRNKEAAAVAMSVVDVGIPPEDSDGSREGSDEPAGGTEGNGIEPPPLPPPTASCSPPAAPPSIPPVALPTPSMPADVAASACRSILTDEVEPVADPGGLTGGG